MVVEKRYKGTLGSDGVTRPPKTLRFGGEIYKFYDYVPSRGGQGYTKHLTAVKHSEGYSVRTVLVQVTHFGTALTDKWCMYIRKMEIGRQKGGRK